MQIGKHIKQIRKTKNMTLVQLSESSGVQIATLSRMENLKMTGTLDSHMKIAKALGVELTELYQDLSSPAQEDAGPGKEQPESFSYNEKASYEILATKILSKKMMPIMLKIEAGGKTNTEQNHAGSEKFIFILEGDINVFIAGQHYPLSPGKTLYFDAAQPHYYENKSKKMARLISVVTPVGL